MKQRAWQITAIAAMVTVAAQTGAWVYWFGGWKSQVDDRLAQHSEYIERHREGMYSERIRLLENLLPRVENRLEEVNAKVDRLLERRK